MSLTLFLSCIKSRVTIFVVIALCVVRALETQSSYRAAQEGLSIFGSYGMYNGVLLAAFIFVPLFCFLLIQPASFLMSNNVAVLCLSRTSFALRHLGCAIQQSVFYAVILNITTLPLVMLSFSLTPEFLLYVLISALLQTLFFVVCALLFFAVSLATRMAYVAFIVVAIYGLWDFMAGLVPGGGVPFIGWDKTVLYLPVITTDVLLGCLYFVVPLALLSLALIMASKRRDFLSKKEI
jgi:hypothetical protein